MRPDISRVFFFRGSCGRVWARQTGFPSLASQLPRKDVRFAKSNLALPFGGRLAPVVAGIATAEFGLDGVSPYHLLDCWRTRPCALSLWGGAGRHLGGIWVGTWRTGNEFRPGWFAHMPPCAALCRAVPLF